MQLAVIEYARNVCGLKGANSTEFDADTPHPVQGQPAELVPGQRVVRIAEIRRGRPGQWRHAGR